LKLPFTVSDLAMLDAALTKHVGPDWPSSDLCGRLNDAALTISRHQWPTGIHGDPVATRRRVTVELTTDDVMLAREALRDYFGPPDGHGDGVRRKRALEAKLGGRPTYRPAKVAHWEWHPNGGLLPYWRAATEDVAA
jgi:hypothetical protein